MGPARPILPGRDLAAVAAFYARLGFAVAGRWGDYLILTRAACELHVFRADPSHDPATSTHGVWITADPDALAAEWAPLGLPDTGIPRLTRPEDKPWGLRELALVDPDGTLLRIGRPR